MRRRSRRPHARRAPGSPQSTNTAGVSATWPVGHWPFGVAVDSTDGRLYVANSGGTTVSVVDPATGTVQSVTTGGQPGGLALDVAARRLYVSNSGGARGPGRHHAGSRRYDRGRERPWASPSTVRIIGFIRPAAAIS